MDRVGRALGPLSNGFKTHTTHNAPPFSRLEFYAFPVGENTIVLNVECGELNVRRRCSRGLKARGKRTLPRVYAADESKKSFDF